MIGFLIFVIISIGFYIYTTKIDKTFFTRMQDKLTNYINEIVKKINPLNNSLFNSNPEMIKINLYLITFNKNIDLYNKIYSSINYTFLITSKNTRSLLFTDIKTLIPSNVQLSEDMITSVLQISYIDDSLFSKLFIDLSNKGVYLVDYWDLFDGLMKPLVIINSINSIETKIDKLNKLHENLINYNDVADPNYISYNLVEINMNKIIEVIFQCILILSNITIKYKNTIDLNDSLINTTTGEQYTIKNRENIDKYVVYIDQLNTFLQTPGFEYEYINKYISRIIINGDTFTAAQENTNYIILYKIFKQIDNMSIFSRDIDVNILPKISNPDI
jgi:hypothetical protein